MRRVAQLGLVGVVAIGMLLAGVRAAQAQGILDTKHNLSTVAGTGANRTAGAQEIYVTAGTNEVCVFCHTPHGADTSVAAPLWNRRVANTTTYQMYTSPTLDSSPDANNMGVSLACLSCHDGTIAFDALRNLPGSGGYDPNAPRAGYTFNSGIIDMSNRGITRIAENGTDLRNDHPIAMVYNDARSPSSTSGDETTGFTTATTTNNGRVWVTRTIGNEAINLPLYGTAVADARVQCASCHDPHRKSTTFLRVSSTDGSKLCLTCHRKDQ